MNIITVYDSLGKTIRPNLKSTLDWIRENLITTTDVHSSLTHIYGIYRSECQDTAPLELRFFIYTLLTLHIKCNDTIIFNTTYHNTGSITKSARK
jgi:hypothetical protein